jgi:cytochrome c oxidase cbb3-type subunit 2
VMPGYPFLEKTPLDYRNIDGALKALSIAGVPYDEEAIANAKADLQAQATPDADTDELMQRYPKAVARDFDGNPAMISELDALIAYLQMMGTLVDFNAYDTSDLKQ